MLHKLHTVCILLFYLPLNFLLAKEKRNVCKQMLYLVMREEYS